MFPNLKSLKMKANKIDNLVLQLKPKQETRILKLDFSQNQITFEDKKSAKKREKSVKIKEDGKARKKDENES